jgi:hypothetical protein
MTRHQRWQLVVLAGVALVFLICMVAPVDIGSAKEFSVSRRVPGLCAHRIVGNESGELGAYLIPALTTLANKGISCFDADIVRCVRTKAPTR